MQTLNIVQLGQVFTSSHIVSLMLSLRQRQGRTLEPSAGNGAFSNHIPDCIAIELDKSVAPKGSLVQDFFAYPVSKKFDTVIGNPPYVRYQDIHNKTKELLDHALFDRRSNLFLFFIQKSIEHLHPGGELIFIVPRDFIKLTAARKLNPWIYKQGTITHWIETGDQKIFQNAVPNCAIFRFEKENYSRTTHWKRLGEKDWEQRTFTEMNGQLAFPETDLHIPLSSLFDVKVGAVSGADDIFEHPKGNLELVCSHTHDTGETRRMLYNIKHVSLNAHRTRLLNRKVRQFNESNWWHWGRGYCQSDSPRIYVNGKTRRQEPFFTHPCKAYDGSILALFPKYPRMNITRAIELLNKHVPWESLGFFVDGRFLFSQRALATCLLPKIFTELQKTTLATSRKLGNKADPTIQKKKVLRRAA